MAVPDFADRDVSLREFAQAYKRSGRYTNDQIDQMAQERFGKGIRQLHEEGFDLDEPIKKGFFDEQSGFDRGVEALIADPYVPEEQVAPSAPLETPAGPESTAPPASYAGERGGGIGEAITDVAIDPTIGALSLVGGAVTEAGRLAVDLPLRAATGYGIGEAEVGRQIDDLERQWNRSVREPVAHLLRTRAGFSEEGIRILNEQDNLWVRNSKPAISNKYVNLGFIPQTERSGNFHLDMSPILVAAQSIINQGGSDAQVLDMLGPYEKQEAQRIFRELSRAKTQLFEDRLDNDPLTQQIYDMESQFQRLELEDRDFISDASDDVAELRDSTFHLLAELLGATEIQDNYRYLQAQGYFGRLAARAAQGFETGRGFTAGMISLPAVLYENPNFARRKPAITAMLLLPFVKGPRGLGRAARARLERHAASEAQAGRPAFQRLLAKLDSIGQAEVPGGLLVRQAERAGEVGTRVPSLRPLQVRDVAAPALKGGLATTPFGIPDIGAAAGAAMPLGRAALTTLAAPRFGQTQQTAQMSQLAGQMTGEIKAGLSDPVMRSIEMINQGVREVKAPLEIPDHLRRLRDQEAETVTGQRAPETGEPVTTEAPARINYTANKERAFEAQVVAERDRLQIDTDGVFPPSEFFDFDTFEPLRVVDDAAIPGERVKLDQRQKAIIADDIARTIKQRLDELNIPQELRPRATGFLLNEMLVDLGDYGIREGQRRRADGARAKEGQGVSDYNNLDEGLKTIFQDEQTRKPAVADTETGLTTADLFDAVVDGKLRQLTEESGYGETFVFEPGSTGVGGGLFAQSTASPKFQALQFLNTPEMVALLQEYGITPGEVATSVNFDGSVSRSSNLGRALEAGLPRREFFEKLYREGARPLPDLVDLDFERYVELIPQKLMDRFEEGLPERSRFDLRPGERMRFGTDASAEYAKLYQRYRYQELSKIKPDELSPAMLDELVTYRRNLTEAEKKPLTDAELKRADQLGEELVPPRATVTTGRSRVGPRGQDEVAYTDKPELSRYRPLRGRDRKLVDDPDAPGQQRRETYAEAEYRAELEKSGVLPRIALSRREVKGIVERFRKDQERLPTPEELETLTQKALGKKRARAESVQKDFIQPFGPDEGLQASVRFKPNRQRGLEDVKLDPLADKASLELQQKHASIQGKLSRLRIAEIERPTTYRGIGRLEKGYAVYDPLTKSLIATEIPYSRLTGETSPRIRTYKTIKAAKEAAKKHAQDEFNGVKGTSFEASFVEKTPSGRSLAAASRESVRLTKARNEIRNIESQPTRTPDQVKQLNKLRKLFQTKRTKPPKGKKTKGTESSYIGGELFVGPASSRGVSLAQTGKGARGTKLPKRGAARRRAKERRKKTREHTRKYGAFTTGDAKALWTRLAKGAFSEYAALVATDIMTGAWFRQGNQKRFAGKRSAPTTTREVRATKQSIANKLQEIGIAAYRNGDYVRAIQMIDEMLNGTDATPGVIQAISDSLNSGPDSYAPGQNLYVGSRMALNLTITDLVGLRSALRGLRGEILDKAVSGRKYDPLKGTWESSPNPYSQIAANINNQAWFRRLARADVDTVRSFNDIVIKAIDASRKGRLKETEGIPKVLKGLSSTELAIVHKKTRALEGDAGKLPQNKMRSTHERWLEYMERRRKAAEEYKDVEPADFTFTEAELLDLLREEAAVISDMNLPTLAEVLDLMSDRPAPKAITELFDVQPGKPIRLGKNTEGVRPSDTVMVDPFLNKSIKNLAGRISQLTDISKKGAHTVLTRMVESIFKEEPTALMVSSDLRAAVKQLAMQRIKLEAQAKHGIFMDKRLMGNLSEALDAALIRYERPFSLLDSAERTMLLENALTEITHKLTTKDGKDITISIDMPTLFKQAMKQIDESANPDLNKAAIMQQAAMRLITNLSDEARQATIFKALKQEHERMGLNVDTVPEFVGKWKENPKSKEVLNYLDEVGDKIAAAVFGRFENSPQGLPFPKEMLDQIRFRMQSDPARLVKVVEEARGAKLTPKERQRLVGKGRIIQGTSTAGEFLAWMDSFGEIGEVRARSFIDDKLALIPFLKKGDKGRVSKKEAETQMVQKEIFPEGSILNQTAETTFKGNDYSVSPEFNRVQGYEIASRLDLENIDALISQNRNDFTNTLRQIHRYIKGSLTTLNATTHIGNAVSNAVVISLLTGKTPIEVFKSVATDTYLYLKWQKVTKKGRKKDIKDFRQKYPEFVKDIEVLERLGLDRNTMAYHELRGLGTMFGDTHLSRLIKDEFGEMGKEPVNAGLVTKFMRSGVRATRAGRRKAMDVYNLGDVSFRISEFRREFAEIRRVVNELEYNAKNMEYVDLRTGPESYTRIYRTGPDQFGMYKKGKLQPVHKAELNARMGRSALRKVNDIIFDYGEIPGFVRFIRDMPLSPIFSPFVTWAYKAVDIPGYKRGLVSNTLFENPAYLSNSPKVMGIQARQMAWRDTRRAALAGGLAGVRDSQDEVSSRLGTFLAESTGFNVGLVNATMTPGIISIWRTTNMDPFSPTMSLLRNVGGIIGHMVLRPEDLLTREQVKELSSRDRHFQLLAKAARGGYLLNEREMRSLLYMGGSPAGQLVMSIFYGKAAQRRGDARIADVTKPLIDMAIGPSLNRALGATVNAVFNPRGDSPTVNAFFGDRRRYLDMKKRVGALGFDYGEAFSEEKELAELYGWWLDSVFYLGSRRQDYPKQVLTLLKTERERLVGSIRKPFLDRIKLVSSAEEKKKIKADMDRASAVIEDVIRNKSMVYEKMFEGMISRDFKTEQGKKRARRESGRLRPYRGQ